MTDDAKEWVTIKVPKEDREAAKERPETYGEVLAAGVEALANGANGAPRLDNMGELDAEEVAERIRAELDTDAPAFDEIQRAVRTIEGRLNNIESMLDGMGGRR